MAIENTKTLPIEIQALKQPFLDQYTSFVLPIILLLVDYLAILGGVNLSYWLRKFVIPLFYSEFDIPTVYLQLIIPFVFILFLHFDRMHIRKMPFWQMAGRVFKSSSYAILAIIVLMYFTGVSQEISRIFVFLVWFLSFSFLVSSRYAVKKMLNSLNLFQVPVILVGAGKTAELLLRSFSEDAGLGYRIVGVIEDHPQLSPISERFPIIGNFKNAEEKIRDAGVQNVIIAAPGLEREKLLDLIYRLQPHVKKVAFVPDLFGIPVSSMEMETFFNEKTVLLKVENNLAVFYNRMLKKCFDIVVSLCSMVFFVPIFLIISALICIDSPGPVIFKHNRIGYQGRIFPCYKFRTMVCNSAEVLQKHLLENHEARAEWDRDFKLKQDPRITRIGSFLRKTSLDELPQLINVLKGEMSLVGPRPIVQAEVERYSHYINDYYLVYPGITGMWQVSGRNDIDYPERVRMDSWYVRNWSLWLDFVMVCKTIRVVLAKKGAY